MSKKTYFHAIKLIPERCTGCTKCVRVCPTEALRVRNKVVELDASRCIDCGKCVASCPFDAIQTYADDLSIIDDFKYKLAIISTSYAGQFGEGISYETAKRGLLHIGFDAVASEAMVTEMMSLMIREYIAQNPTIKPVLSSNCPSIVRLIQVRFPSLLPNLLHIEAPMSVLAMYYRDKVCREQNLDSSEVGIFLIVPCVSQVTAVHQPEGTYVNLEDGAISIGEVYKRVMADIKDIQKLDMPMDVYPKGLSWAISGVKAEEVNDGKLRTMDVSGVHNVIKVLHDVENNQLDVYDYIVLNSCTNGCVGGVLNVENPFVATSRIRQLLRNATHKDFHDELFLDLYHEKRFDVLPLEPRPIMQLDVDIKTALTKMKQINDIVHQLPGLDCSACGSPTCMALAEDIISGKAELDDCVVRMRRQKIQKEG
jgi:Na+-translocating ferredoxin:NAD+ oxidoreductase RNF subunit RnfB